MRTRHLVTAATVAIIAALAAWLIMPHRAPVPADVASPATDRSQAVATAPDPDAAGGSETPDEAVRDQVLAAYFEPLRFRDEITGFIETVDERDTAQIEARLEALSRRIRDYQQAGYLALPQARYLEGTLITAVYRDDEPARRLALEDLRAEYAERAEAPSTAHLDERFEAYKAREAEIVRDVLDNDPPEGVSRDEWLRQRLDTLREEIYAEE